MIRTSSILVAKIGKPPNIPQANCVANASQEKLKPTTPRTALTGLKDNTRIYRTRIHVYAYQSSDSLLRKTTKSCLFPRPLLACMVTILYY